MRVAKERRKNVWVFREGHASLKEKSRDCVCTALNTLSDEELRSFIRGNKITNAFFEFVPNDMGIPAFAKHEAQIELVGKLRKLGIKVAGLETPDIGGAEVINKQLQGCGENAIIVIGNARLGVGGIQAQLDKNRFKVSAVALSDLAAQGFELGKGVVHCKNRDEFLQNVNAGGVARLNANRQVFRVDGRFPHLRSTVSSIEAIGAKIERIYMNDYLVPAQGLGYEARLNFRNAMKEKCKNLPDADLCIALQDFDTWIKGFKEVWRDKPQREKDLLLERIDVGEELTSIFKSGRLEALPPSFLLSAKDKVKEFLKSEDSVGSLKAR